MSLTNPNKVVTEQRLNEYHNAILPYLGGMPEMVANKFSKGDLYSTDEKMIGQWIDGKPLYQKTVNCGDLPNNTTKNVAHGISNLGTVCNFFGCSKHQYDNETIKIPNPATVNTCGVSVDVTNIIIMTNANYSNYTESYLTIQYTKTTDSPISIGSDTDYSTEEKIVGTWIDGKPIYQCTFVKSSDFSTDFYLTDLSDFNIEKIIKGDGWWSRMADGTITQYPFGRTETPTYSGFDMNICYAADVKKLRVIIGGYNIIEINEVRYTIQYTKTTD